MALAYGSVGSRARYVESVGSLHRATNANTYGLLQVQVAVHNSRHENLHMFVL
jgi:hypothetical protein